MTADQKKVMKDCVALSLQGKATFGEVVGRLGAIGVERYHTDYSRRENTYYMPDGETFVVAMDHPPVPIADTFSADAIQTAIRDVQRGRIVYPDFVRKTAAAGCVGYFAELAGRRVVYFGRNGDVHVEPFPPASAPPPTAASAPSR
jgi:uncharacterized protein YbcV (DUF1398 family)